jgi:hypothetical protein
MPIDFGVFKKDFQVDFDYEIDFVINKINIK